MWIQMISAIFHIKFLMTKYTVLCFYFFVAHNNVKYILYLDQIAIFGLGFLR